MKKLNLGSAGIKKEGYINVDINPLVNPDVIWDLNKYPYPFEDDEFDLVEASHILEHLNLPLSVMNEIYRVLKPGGTAIIKVPHFSRALVNPDHKRGFDVTFPNYVCSEFGDIGNIGADFELISMRMNWIGFFHIMEKMKFSKFVLLSTKALNSVINFFANLNPYVCSRLWCMWVAGFEEMEFVFKKRID